MTTTRLDRGLVARTALDVLNEVGLDGLSLRAIAGRLDVKAPALYWHFKDKQALLDEMATEILRRVTAAAPAPDPDWRVGLAHSMRALRAELLRYRDGAKVYSGTHFTDTAYGASMDAYLRTFTDAGFTTRAAARAWFTAYSYTIGYVTEEQAMGPDPADPPANLPVDPPADLSADPEAARSGAYDLAARAERLAAYPLAAAAGEELFLEREAGFEAGLAAVVAGIGHTLAPGAPGASGV
ncbi:TetR/AcrR family transcriptional regulator C-terminal domain-containing protein [Streptomyces sp. NPDC091212]|uniref:TetR/AcrR family transcriptional regulator C-terminal domain-containing protein n=1 Tax=Streptomyces sp. NPDC091212 TaxID=3155191 RepID=UPI0034496FB8